MFNLLKHLFIATTAFLAVINPFHNTFNASVLPTPTPTQITPSPTAVYQPQTNQNTQQTITQSDPIIDCVGPDGKHLKISQKACDDFNNAWKNPQQNTLQNQVNSPPQQSSGNSNGYSNYSSVTCVTQYGTYTEWGTSQEDATNNCTSLQQYTQGLKDRNIQNEAQLQDLANKYNEIVNRKPPTFAPPPNVPMPTFSSVHIPPTCFDLSGLGIQMDCSCLSTSPPTCQKQ